MLLKTIDQKIRKAFCDASIQYDVLASLQREIGRELTKELKTLPEASNILDVGMGTGWLTKRLKNHFPDSCVVGIDFADGMIERAKAQESDFKIVQADAARLPFKDGTFDLITSNLAYQWVENLNESFSLCKRQLKDGGRLTFTMFGYNTLQELFVSLEKSVEHRTENLGIARLARKENIEESLKTCGFRDICVEAEEIRVRFPDMLALIKWIKNIGANRLKKETFIGRDVLNRANEYYKKNFTDRLGIYATFEVIWVDAQK